MVRKTQTGGFNMKLRMIFAATAAIVALVFATACAGNDENGYEGNGYNNGIGALAPSDVYEPGSVYDNGETQDEVPATLNNEAPANAAVLSGTFVAENGEPGFITFTGNAFEMAFPENEFDPNSEYISMHGIFTVNENTQTIHFDFDESSLIDVIRHFATLEAMQDPFFAENPMLHGVIDSIIDMLFSDNIDINQLFTLLIHEIAYEHFMLEFAEVPWLVDFAMSFIDVFFGTADLEDAISALVVPLTEMLGLGMFMSEAEVQELIDEMLDEMLDELLEDMYLMISELQAEMEAVFMELNFMLDDLMSELSFLFDEELNDVVFTFGDSFDRLYDPDGYAMIRR